jgi:hypothetical protein
VAATGEALPMAMRLPFAELLQWWLLLIVTVSFAHEH